MVDWVAHYDAIYRLLGVSAVLTIADSGTTFDLTVIDKTAGVEVADGSASRNALPVSTIKPACALRVYELTANGVTLEQTQGAQIAFNGAAWRVENRMMRPSPGGEQQGEVWLILIEDRSG